MKCFIMPIKNPNPTANTQRVANEVHSGNRAQLTAHRNTEPLQSQSGDITGKLARTPALSRPNIFTAPAEKIQCFFVKFGSEIQPYCQSQNKYTLPK